MTVVRPLLTYDQARAVRLRLRGEGLADIARDLKLDSCFESRHAAVMEVRQLIDTAADILDDATGFGEEGP